MGVPRNTSRSRLRAEFTTEPFHGEGDPPRHAVRACERVRETGMEPEFGPLGTSLSGDRDSVLRAVTGVLETVLDEGADRITLQVSIEPGPDEPGTDEPGTDEPGTDEPGPDESGPDEPGTDEQGTDEPGPDESGPDEPTS